ncbi:MAG: M24 family metallopeptidase [Proteobacteria bacterium]|nr:M24 family metallopeptidase [Pseudomonadota bacterium]
MVNALAGAGRFFPQDEYEDRWSRVHAAMEGRGLDTAVVWGRSGGSFDRCGDVLYLSNFYSTATGHGIDSSMENREVSQFNARAHNAVIMRQGELPELQADEDTPREELMPIPTDRIEWHHNTIKGVADSLNASRVKGRVALVGSDFLPMKYWWQLKDLTPDIEWVPEDDLVLKLRRIKSPREMDALRESGAIGSRALSLLMQNLSLGRSEAESAAAAAAELTRSGGRSHLIAVSHGEFIHYFCQNPLTGYSQDTPKEGELVRAWIYGPLCHGYYVDPGRTAVVGRKPTPEQKELIETNAKYCERLMEAVRPGVKVMEIAQLGDELMHEFGSGLDQLSEKWPHYGHSLGLFIETPFFGKSLCSSDDIYEEGWACGVEIFLSKPGVGSSGFEQNFIVHKDHNEPVTTAPMLWWD